MTTSSKYQIWAILSIAVAAVLAGISGGTRTDAERVFFLSALEKFATTTVAVGTASYDVGESVTDSGRLAPGHAASLALRTAWYATSARIDPLLGIEGTAPDDLVLAVQDLQSSIEEFAVFYDENEGASLRQSLYPLRFLNDLAVLETRRLELIRSPSPQAVAEYHLQLAKTLGSYRSDLRGFSEALAATPAQGKYDTFNFLDGLTTLDHLREFFDTLDRRALEAQDIAMKRYSCFLGTTSTCAPLAFPSAKRAGAMTEDEKSSLALPPNVKENAALLLDYQTALGVGSLRRGDTFVFRQDHNACFPFSKEPGYYSMRWNADEEGNVNYRADYINALYAYEPPAALGSPYLESLARDGVSVMYQSVTNNYLCRTAIFAHTAARTATHIRTELTRHPIFAAAGAVHDDPGAAELAAIESTITNADALSDDLFAEYTARLRAYLSGHGERTVAEAIGRDNVIRAGQLVTAHYQQSPALDEVARMLISINLIVETFNKRDWKPDLRFLFLTRSYPMFFFLAHNPSISGQPSPSLIEPQRADLRNFHLSRLSDWQSKSGASREETVDILVRSRHLEFMIDPGDTR